MIKGSGGRVDGNGTQALDQGRLIQRLGRIAQPGVHAPQDLPALQAEYGKLTADEKTLESALSGFRSGSERTPMRETESRKKAASFRNRKPDLR